MSKLDALKKWHETKPGLLTFALVELGLAYLFVSLAIDSGSILDYAIALIALAGFLQNIIRLIGRLVRERRH